MDVPTRQSYVMAVVKPAERLAAAGATNLVRSGGWALAPMFAGALMQSVGLAVPPSSPGPPRSPTTCCSGASSGA